MPSFYQGFFLAPTVVAGALKGAIFAANIYEKLGFRVVPNGTESRHDIIQAVELGSAEAHDRLLRREFRPPRRWTATSAPSRRRCRATTPM